MEINEKTLAAAKEIFEAGLGNNTSVVEHQNVEELKEAVASVGQRNTTALGDGEIAEFFDAKAYEENADKYLIHTQSTSSNGRTFDRVYALCNRYFLVGNKKVGEHLSFIDIGGMVRRHYDLTGLAPDAEGKIKGAVRVVTPGDFNNKLEAYKQPWSMLTQFLAGKKIRAKRSTDKLFFQEFVNRQPVPDKYVEQTYMVYNFA